MEKILYYTCISLILQCLQIKKQNQEPKEKWAENVNNRFEEKEINVFNIQQNAQSYSQLKKQMFKNEISFFT